MAAPETYVTKARFAAMRGVHKSTVTRWVQAGRITLTRSGLVDVAAADAQLSATESPQPHHQARREQIAAEKAAQCATDRAPQPAPPGPQLGGRMQGGPEDDGMDGASPEIMGAGLRQRLARAQYEENRAALAAMDLAERKRDLIRRTDAEFVIDDLCHRLGGLLERMADQLTPVIVSHQGDTHQIHTTLFEAGRDLRRELAGYLQRKGLEVGHE